MNLRGAIKQLHELRSAEDMPVYYKLVIAEVINVLLMDAQEVKHGHWVHGKELSRDYIGDVCVSVRYDKCWCSECCYQVEEFGLPLWTYCPICGAKMDGVKEDAK